MAAALPVFKAIAPIFGTLLGGGSSPPAPAPPPPPPPVQPAPPPPEVSTAPDVGEEPVIDSEAARLRASKRRKAAEDEKLFALSEDSNDAVSLSKSLLGE